MKKKIYRIKNLDYIGPMVTDCDVGTFVVLSTPKKKVYKLYQVVDGVFYSNDCVSNIWMLKLIYEDGTLGKVEVHRYITKYAYLGPTDFIKSKKFIEIPYEMYSVICDINRAWESNVVDNDSHKILNDMLNNFQHSEKDKIIERYE